MKIEKREEQKKDNSRPLSGLKGGDVFHFATDSFESALKSDAIYMVVAGGKDGRVQIANITDGLLLQRDDCHRVCILNTTMLLDS